MVVRMMLKSMLTEKHKKLLETPRNFRKIDSFIHKQHLCFIQLIMLIPYVSADCPGKIFSSMFSDSVITKKYTGIVEQKLLCEGLVFEINIVLFIYIFVF